MPDKPDRNKLSVKQVLNKAWDEVREQFIIGKVSRGLPFVSNGTVAVAGTPNDEDINAALGRNGNQGFIENVGPQGDLEVAVSNDGASFSSPDIIIEKNEILDLEGLDIDTVRVDATVNGVNYRLVVI